MKLPIKTFGENYKFLKTFETNFHNNISAIYYNNRNNTYFGMYPSGLYPITDRLATNMLYENNNRKNLGCDVELGNIGDTIKYGTILLVGGGLVYAMWRFNLFGGLRWIKDAMQDLYKAPETIRKWTDAEIGTRVDQIDKIFNILKIKNDNFSIDYKNINNEWQKLKQKAITNYGKESYRKTFYESGKEYYFGSKPTKEKIMSVLDRFRTKALQALRQLQAKKGFKIKGDWSIVDGLNCIPCLFG